MKISNIQKQFKGVTFQEDKTGTISWYKAQNNKKEISFRCDHNYGSDVEVIHIRSLNDVSDMQTDYFAGYFYRTIKSAVYAFNQQ